MQRDGDIDVADTRMMDEDGDHVAVVVAVAAVAVVGSEGERRGEL